MPFLFSLRASLALLLLLAPAVLSQLVSDLPQCWQNCVNDRNFSCADTDLSCICQLSDGHFLPSVVTCIKSNCDNALDDSLLITPLQALCASAGHPIPSSIIISAEQAEQTATSTLGSITTSDGGLVGVITTTTGGGFSTSTVTGYVLDSAGNKHSVAVPLVYDSSTTIYGQPVTITDAQAIATGRPTPIPLGGASSLAASTSSSSAASSSSTSTISSTTMSTSQTPISVSSLTSNTPISTTTASSSSSHSTTSQSPSTSATSTTDSNGSPFSMQGAGTRQEAGSWLGLTIVLLAGISWY
ncbi:hypothetical protein MMC12_003236 [Toensbergia leucococca]|nr:hypothetical protein [Toensbergia leucococca]